MRLALSAIVFGFMVLGFIPKPSLAATSSVSFGVSATVQSTCQASTPASAFGGYPVAWSSPVAVNCTYLTPYNVSLSTALPSSDIQNTVDISKLLLINTLRLTPARAARRGQFATTDAMPRTGNHFAASHSGYVVALGTRPVASGAFADAITVTVTY
jgi:spore coat protein U-like protein